MLDMEERKGWPSSSLALMLAAAAAGLALGAPQGGAMDIQRATGPTERWALIVGTDEQPGPEPEHRVTLHQQAIAQALRTTYGYRASNVRELYGGDATAERLREETSRLLSGVGPSDTLFVFASLPRLGTGTDEYLVPFGGRQEEPWTLLPAFELNKLLGGLVARSSLLVVPSCSEVGQLRSLFLNYNLKRSPGTVWLLTVCDSPRAPSPRTDFARGLRNALAPDRSGGRLTAVELAKGLDQASSRVQLTNLPDYSREDFVFAVEASRLGPHLARLRDPAPKVRESAIDDLVRAVLSEPADTRGGLTREAGEALVGIAREPSGSTRYRAVSALAEIGYGPAAPVLGELLARSEDAALRQGAVESLAKLGGNEATPHLRRAMADPAPVVRMAAIRALGARGDDSSFDALRDAALSDGVEDVRLAALQALTSLKVRGAAVRGIAADLLTDASPAVRREVASALGSLGKGRVSPQLLALVRSDTVASVRQAAAFSVARSFVEEDRAAVQRALADATGDGDAGVRQAAAWGLGEIGGTGSEARLERLLNDADPGVRRNAAEALGRLRSARSLSRLASASRDRAPEVRQAAVAAMGSIGDPNALEALLAAVNDENAYVRAEAQKALKAIPGAPAGDLAAGLRSPLARTRAEAAQKAGETGDPRYVESLIPLLGDTDFGVRQRAIAALGRMRQDVALPRVLMGLRDPNPAVRQGAVAVLGIQGRHEALADVTAAAKDPNPAVRAEAVRSLAAIDAQGSMMAIVGAAQDPDIGVRLSAVEALGGIALPEAREALQRLARDPSPQVRQKAIEVLGYAGRY
jgi:HEAT repeat protein